MAKVIPFTPLSQDTSRDGEPAKVLSLRSRLFERAVEEAWRERIESPASDSIPPRLRVVK